MCSNADARSSSSDAVYIIDFEAFQHGKMEDTVIKELCIMAANNPLKSINFVFRPPCDWSCLSADQRRTYSFEERCLHRLTWNEGTLQFCETCVQNMLIGFCGTTTTTTQPVFLALGVQKVKVLQHKLPKLCILDYRDIDDNCRDVSINKLPPAPIHITCTYRNHGRKQCAVLKCFRLCMHYVENVIRPP